MGIANLMHEGVYICCCGPNYETPAEARALSLLGADVAGETPNAAIMLSSTHLQLCWRQTTHFTNYSQSLLTQTGMSTTAETIVAHHAGMKVLALSLVTSQEILDNDREEKVNHEDVLETSLQRVETMTSLITRVLAAL
ncbi:unnamed protein product [Mesocestoides corti]|uniref:purine-nucleoside phosphorylase n=1 Tax=Mesocestoides corti TaxID=53468 RepID=A0A0R3URJ0_MESCO|nr:unnamed protein product [Mesocestoides corti]